MHWARKLFVGFAGNLCTQENHLAEIKTPATPLSSKSDCWKYTSGLRHPQSRLVLAPPPFWPPIMNTALAELWSNHLHYTRTLTHYEHFKSRDITSELRSLKCGKHTGLGARKATRQQQRKPLSRPNDAVSFTFKYRALGAATERGRRCVKRKEVSPASVARGVWREPQRPHSGGALAHKELRRSGGRHFRTSHNDCLKLATMFLALLITSAQWGRTGFFYSSRRRG